MPAIGLYCSKTDKKMTFEEGIEYFEEQGAMPSEAIIAIINDAKAHEGKHTRLSPSMCDEETTCRRQIMLERFVDYYLDPVVSQESCEGQVYHNSFQASGQGLKGWKQEVVFPIRHDPLNSKAVNPVIDPDDGKACYEMWPGVLMCGRADKVKNDSTVLTDLKTTKYPKTFGNKLPTKDYGDDSNQRSWPIQLGMYRRMVEMATGKAPDDLRVWRYYRGSREKSLTWKRFKVPVMHMNTIWRIIGEFVTSTQGYLKGAMQIEKTDLNPEAKQHALKMYAKTVPADGYNKKMFNNQKCYKWCAARDICLGELMGKTQF